MFPLHPQEHDQPADFLTAAMKFSCFSSKEICLVFYHTLFLFLCYLPSVKNNVWKDSTLLFLFSSWKSGWPCDFPPKTPQVAWSVIPVNWIILRWLPVVRTDGRTYAHVIPKFLGWIYYQVFLGMGLCARAWRSAIKSFLKMQTKEKVESLHLGLASYHPWTRHRVVENQAKEKW